MAGEQLQIITDESDPTDSRIYINDNNPLPVKEMAGLNNEEAALLLSEIKHMREMMDQILSHLRVITGADFS